MSTPKRSLAERIDEALAKSDITPEEADKEALEERERIKKALRHFSSGARTLRPGQDPETTPVRRRKTFLPDGQ